MDAVYSSNHDENYEDNVPLDDSLEFANNANKDTYRVGLPQPHPISSEEEFMTNSGRQVKSNIYNDHDVPLPTSYRESNDHNIYDQKNVRKMNNISDSLKGQLHLSLDRLSQASYDQGDLNQIKIKKNGLHVNSVKTYPVIAAMQSAEDNNFNTGYKHPSPSNETPASQKSLNKVDDPASYDLLEKVSLSRMESDDDDIHTVVVEDSLSLDVEDQLEEPETRVPAMMNSKDHSRLNARNDPYSHLRYNQEWREQSSLNPSIQQTGVEIEYHHQQQHQHLQNLQLIPEEELENGSTINMHQQPSGAIIIHNQDLSPNRLSTDQHIPVYEPIYRNAPVRLSSNPALLLKVNQHYEEEFERYLENEQRSTIVEADDPGSKPPSGSQRIDLRPNLKANMKPPMSYPKSKPPLTNITSENINSRIKSDGSSRRQRDSNDIHGGSSHLDKVNHEITSPANLSSSGKSSQNIGKIQVPTPPKAPKSNRDYIEFNKTRLSRKSNSASYLEMYAKKNRQQDVEKTNQERRPKSDTNRKKKNTDNLKSPPRKVEAINENEMDMSLEDRWQQQAERLKLAKESKLKRTPRRDTLREVGNQKQVPQFHPADVIGSHRINATENASRIPEHNQQTAAYESSPQHLLSSSRDTNFTYHPAFTSFQNSRTPAEGVHAEYADHELGDQYSSRHDISDDQTNDYYRTPYSHHMNPYSAENHQLMNQQNYYVEQEYILNRGQDNGYSNNQLLQEQEYDGRNSYRSPPLQTEVYHQIIQNHQPSPIMQAFQQRMLQPRPYLNHTQNIPLPSNHVIRWEETAITPNRHRTNFDSVAPPGAFMPYHQGGKKHVNFEPGLQTPTSSSRIPVPVRTNALYRYPVPLPPTPPGGNHSVRSVLEKKLLQQEFSEGLCNDEYSNGSYGAATDFYRHQPIPILPPIIGGKKSSPRLHDSSNDSGIVEHSPRRSLSDSETGGGSYLQRYERQKQKPNYKKYTLNDYKNLKRDIHLGGLGPDLMAAKAKMEKVERAKKYAEFVRQEHKNNAVVSERKPPIDETDAKDNLFKEGKQHFTKASETERKREEKKEKRKRAIDYAKQVPKPKLPPQASPSQNNASPESNHESSYVDDRNNAADWDLLKNLRERHEREKAMLAEFTSRSKVP